MILRFSGQLLVVFKKNGEMPSQWLGVVGGEMV
jgi:hypothetical protein